MRITGIETFKFWVDWMNWLFVRIDTDEGLSGWGEGSLHGALDAVETAIREYAPHLIGQDPSGPERHWHRLYHAWRWRGGAVLQTALSALDIALWDLVGKVAGQPLYRLWGGVTDRIAAYVGIWALQMLFWPRCETDGRDDFLHDPDAQCASCDAGRLIAVMKDILCGDK